MKFEETVVKFLNVLLNYKKEMKLKSIVDKIHDIGHNWMYNLFLYS